MEKTLEEMILSGEIGFPYKRTFIGPPDQYFKNIVAMPEKYVRFENDRSRTYPYVGGSKAFVVTESAYPEVDIMTDLFTEGARMYANIKRRMSPLDAWGDANHVASIAAAARARSWKTGEPPCSPHNLREAIYETVPECTQFKVSLASAVCRHFRAVNVLDPFSGWGDRALGAAAAGVKRYVGTDPNLRLRPGYEMIADFLKHHAPATSIKFRPIPAEEYGGAQMREDLPPGEKFDLVFSSPPFFDYETYDSGAKQSIVTHKTYVEWANRWFGPLIMSLWDMIAEGGHLAIYMADSPDAPATTALVNAMRGKGTYLGRISCRRGRKRPIPLWVWKKERSSAE
jgi:16S rRNA G966 N2-methylase RsmD